MAVTRDHPRHRGFHFVSAFGGLIAGVCAGLMLIAIQGKRDAQVAESERTRQLSFFKDWRDSMREVRVETEGVESNLVSFTADQVRHWEVLIRIKHIRRVLEGRSSRLTFDEIYEVEEAHDMAAMVLDQVNQLSQGACMEILVSFETTFCRWVRRQLTRSHCRQVPVREFRSGICPVHPSGILSSTVLMHLLRNKLARGIP